MAERLAWSPTAAKEVSLETVKRAAQGDDAAFSVLAERFSPALSHMLSSLPVPEEEKGDLRQEGLIGLYKAVLLFDPALSSFSTFAGVCMRSGVMEGLRKYLRDHRGASLELPTEDLPAEGTFSPERVLLGREALFEVLQRIDQILSPMERRALGLHLQGKSNKEAAHLLGKSAKSVENTLFRARKKLSSLFHT